MKIRLLTVVAVLLCCALVMPGCAKKADETKPIEDVKAEAAEMDVDELEEMVEVYKDALAEKEEEVKKLADELKEIPITELTGDKAKGLTADIDEIKDSVSALTERMEIYAKQLKEKAKEVVE